MPPWATGRHYIGTFDRNIPRNIPRTSPRTFPGSVVPPCNYIQVRDKTGWLQVPSESNRSSHPSPNPCIWIDFFPQPPVPTSMFYQDPCFNSMSHGFLPTYLACERIIQDTPPKFEPIWPKCHWVTMKSLFERKPPTDITFGRHSPENDTYTIECLKVIS